MPATTQLMDFGALGCKRRNTTTSAASPRCGVISACRAWQKASGWRRSAAAAPPATALRHPLASPVRWRGMSSGCHI